MKTQVSFHKLIFSAFIWTYVAFDTVITFLALFILKPFDRKQTISYRVIALWGESIVRLNPFWKIRVIGREHIKNGKGYILVANHMSLADITCLFCLRKHFKWVAKDSLFKIPVFGWCMSLMNYIRLSRGKHGSIRDSFQKAQEWLAKDVSVLIFPEGTRSESGSLSTFKNGAFKLAILTGKPIIPIVIKGTAEALSKGSMTMTGQVKGSVKVFPKIDVDSYSAGQHDELRDRVWTLMNEELKKS
jgi:1-acyl-sn-glycerol-3-phosphate acyltransferase